MSIKIKTTFDFYSFFQIRLRLCTSTSFCLIVGILKKVVCRELTTLRATINLEGKPIPISTWNINTTKMKCVPFSPLYPWQPFVTTAICYFQKRKRSKGTRVGCHKSITCETTTTTLLIVAPSPLLWSGRKIFRWERLRRNMS